jgi:hypothetical protein
MRVSELAAEEDTRLDPYRDAEETQLLGTTRI